MRLIRKKYDQDYFNNPLHKQESGSQRNFLRVNTLRKLKQQGLLLDVGCGEGHLIEIAGKYYQAEGIDVSDYAVKSALANGHQARVADINHTSLPKNAYDIISVFNILEHLASPHQPVENLYSALKKEGVLIGSVPNNYGLIGSLSTRLTNIFDRTHQFTPAPHTWHAIFKQSGFSRIKFFGEFTFTKNISSYLDFKGWQYLSFNLVFVCHKD